MRSYHFIVRSLLMVWLPVLLLTGCVDQQFPEYRPQPSIKTKTLHLIFIDKANPTASVAIYVNNVLLSNESPQGLQRLVLPDSLATGTLTISLAEYAATNPSKTLLLQDLIYETFLLPSEFSTVSTVVMARDNPASPIVLSKAGVSSVETAPDPGYFKVRFYNVSSNKVDVFRRSGSAYTDFADLNIAEERAYQQLSFGTYRFLVRKKSDGSVLGTPPVFNGEAGKMYDVLCTDGGQVITELGDFGVSKPFGYIGYLNLLPNQMQVTALPLQGAVRTESVPKVYTHFDGVELVPAGNTSIAVEVGQEILTATYNVRPYDYLMVYIVDNYGKPELRIIPTPMNEPGLNGTLSRYLNYASDTSKVSFASIRTDIVLSGIQELPASIVAKDYATNLKFGEVRTSKPLFTGNNEAAKIYTTENALILQAYKATSDPDRLGDPISGARIDYPFFITRPTQPVADYKGAVAEDATYSVLLSGKPDEENPVFRTKITVICHSF